MLTRSEIQCEHQELETWKTVLFSEFVANLESKTKPFPCIFGAAGLNKDELRFVFLDRVCAGSLAPVLFYYLKSARKFGDNTSLVVFFRPEPVQSLEVYERRFWNLLADLAQNDPAPWPSDFPDQIQDERWEFCFAGEPVFVVCNSPAHVLRQSRRSSSFMVTFQPRWVFDTILGTPEAARRSTTKVRKRLVNYDAVEISPHLGLYGEKGKYEYKQYFLRDDNGEVQCPFASLNIQQERDEVA
ncbi:MAG: YqcI/YcgG family protein [Rhodobacter sp.]|nr:YqcI/YcgG family protein [Rhodobacter sp.]